MYGGVSERQLRGALAAALGFAAALLPWPTAYEAAGRSFEITLLAPRGRIEGAPTRLCWTSDASATRIRLCIRDRQGAIVAARTVAIGPGERSLRLTPEERSRVQALPAGTIELSALAEDGELLARSAPERFALQDRGSDGGADHATDGW